MRNDTGSAISKTAAGALLSLALAGCAVFEEAPERALVPVVPAVEEPSAIESTAESGIVAAEPVAVQLNPEAPLRYVVQKGDTLWGISNKFLRDSWQWPELWYANPDVQNPHLIYPGDVLYLTWVDGAPRLARAGDAPPPASAGGEPAAVQVPPADTDKLSPRVREMDLAQAIGGIPLDAIRGFLRGPRLISKDELDDAPYVVDFEDDHIMAGAGELAYVLGIEDRRIAQYQIVRLGEKYRDPDDGDVIGYEAKPVADAEVRVFGDPSTVYLKRSDIETRIGDHLLPVEVDALSTRFYPHAPQRRVNGRIISVYNGVSQIGQYQIVALNRGTEIGLEPGHMLSVIQTGRVSKDPQSFFGSKVQLPDINAGSVMVFKVAPRVSYALVMTAVRQIHLLDKLETPDPNVDLNRSAP